MQALTVQMNARGRTTGVTFSTLAPPILNLAPSGHKPWGHAIKTKRALSRAAPHTQAPTPFPSYVAEA